MSKVVRGRRAPQVERQSPSLKTKEAVKRASAISLRLREREGWVLTSASVCQAWTLQLDGMRYRIEALVSLFLEGTRGPGFVFNVTIRSARAKRPIREHVVSTPWFRGLQARLGQEYVNDEVRAERVSLVRVLRGTTDPSRALDELHHVAAAIEGKSIAPRRNRRPSPTVKSSEEQRDDVWTILDALPTTGWRLSSVTQGLQRQVRHDGCRWHVSATFVAHVETAKNHPGFAGMIGSWSRRAERTKRANPISKATSLLRGAGYRRLADTHYQRWHRGLGLRAANREIELLERGMQRMVERSDG